MEKAKQAKGREEKKYLPPRGKRRSKACRLLVEGTGEVQTSVKAPSKVTWKTSRFRGARGAH